MLQRDLERARTLGREIKVESLGATYGQDVVRMARDGHYELIVLPLPQERPLERGRLCGSEMNYVLTHAHCPVFLAAHPVIPAEVSE